MLQLHGGLEVLVDYFEGVLARVFLEVLHEYESVAYLLDVLFKVFLRTKDENLVH